MKLTRARVVKAITQFMTDSKLACGGDVEAGKRSREVSKELEILMRRWRARSLAQALDDKGETENGIDR